MILFFTRLIMGIFLLILAFQNGITGFTVFYWILFIFHGMANSPHAAVFNAEVPSDKRSTLLSFESLFLQFGGLIGSLFMGYLANTVSIPVAWYFGAGFLAISSLAYVFLPKSSLKHQEDASEAVFESWDIVR